MIENDEFVIVNVKHENIEASFMNFGATTLSVKVPDKHGNKEQVLLAYKDISTYLDGEMYLNAIIGPSSGRIKDAYYEIDGSPYYLDKNFLDKENLHGGADCFAFKFFDYKIIDEETQTQVIFTYRNLESGSNYPGNQNITVIYTVRDTELKLEFLGDTTEPTLMNLTTHMYFNLSGNLQRDIKDSELYINASNTLELDETFVPYKEVAVEGTILDFRTPRLLNDVLTEDIYKRKELGVDNPFLLDTIDYTVPNATLENKENGRLLEVFTTYPSIVCYTHNHPDYLPLEFDKEHTKHLGICFETQNPPNGVNIDGLENSILFEGEDYYHKTLYKFSIKE